jgi:hypothetical protein
MNIYAADAPGSHGATRQAYAEASILQSVQMNTLLFSVPSFTTGMTIADRFEKAERLRSELVRLNSAQIKGLVDSSEHESQAPVAIVCWLRSEFSS